MEGAVGIAEGAAEVAAKTTVEAAPAVAKGAAEAVPVAAETVVPTVGSVAEAGTPVIGSVSQVAEANAGMGLDAIPKDNPDIVPQINSSISEGSVVAGGENLSPNILNKTDKALEGLEERVSGLQAKEGASPEGDGINIEGVNQVNSSGAQPEEGKSGENQADFKIITSDPEYQQILGEKVAQSQAKGEKPDLKNLQLDALTEYIQRQTEETEEQIENGQKSPLTPEQKKEISEAFGKGFKKHPGEMSEISKKTIQLAKAKAREANLRKDPKATEEQRTIALDKVAEIQKKYDEAFEKFENTVGKENPKIVENLKKSLENNEVLDILKKEKNKHLLRLILELVAVATLSSFQETTEKTNPVKIQGQ